MLNLARFISFLLYKSLISAKTKGVKLNHKHLFLLIYGLFQMYMCYLHKNISLYFSLYNLCLIIIRFFIFNWNISSYCSINSLFKYKNLTIIHTLQICKSKMQVLENVVSCWDYYALTLFNLFVFHFRLLHHMCQKLDFLKEHQKVRIRLSTTCKLGWLST